MRAAIAILSGVLTALGFQPFGWWALVSVLLGLGFFLGAPVIADFVKAPGYVRYFRIAAAIPFLYAIYAVFIGGYAAVTIAYNLATKKETATAGGTLSMRVPATGR